MNYSKICQNNTTRKFTFNDGSNVYLMTVMKPSLKQTMSKVIDIPQKL